MLRTADLNHDPVLTRRIKRLQEDKAREAEQSDGEEDSQVSVSQQPTQPRIKVSSSARLQAPSVQEPPRSSIVDDLGSSSDEDE